MALVGIKKEPCHGRCQRNAGFFILQGIPAQSPGAGEKEGAPLGKGPLSHESMAVLAQEGSASRKPRAEPSGPHVEQILSYMVDRLEPWGALKTGNLVTQLWRHVQKEGF